MPSLGSQITDENLMIAFILLKRAQHIMGVSCRHTVPDEVKFILDQAQSLADKETATDVRNRFNTFNNQGA